MPFLDPEELKPKLREVFETVVIPQIKKAKMKQTAVEFIESEVKMSDGVLTKGHLLSIIEQAKQMEKEQKIKFAEHCLDKALDLDIRTAFSNVEQYYNETFKSH